MTSNFEGKTVLITGGGSGIGRVAALGFAAAGANVVVNNRSEAGGEETVAMIEKTGGKAMFIKADVMNAEEVQAMVTQTVGAFGRLDCAVNNAGIQGKLAPLHEQDETDYDQIVGINLKGVWLCMKYEVAQMLQQGGGSIVNVASVGGLIGAGILPIYCASKHGVIGLTKSAAAGYSRAGIRINAVCPTVTETRMTEITRGIMPGLVEFLVEAAPIGRIAEAKEVAQVILWLASDDAAYVAGAAIPVDGGYTVQ